MLEGHLLQLFLGLVEFKARCSFNKNSSWLLRSYWAGGEKTEDLGQAEVFLRLTKISLWRLSILSGGRGGWVGTCSNWGWLASRGLQKTDTLSPEGKLNQVDSQFIGHFYVFKWPYRNCIFIHNCATHQKSPKFQTIHIQSLLSTESEHLGIKPRHQCLEFLPGDSKAPPPS